MANILRSVNTRFWTDPFIEECTPSEKLLFLYLLTNPLTNLLGIYEVTLKRISYDTGLNSDAVRKGFEKFSEGGKAFFDGQFVILPNFMKNQNLNPNMKVAVQTQFDDLPKWLQVKILGNSSEWLPNGSICFERLSKALEGFERLSKIEVEVEDEIEVEVEDEFKGEKTILINQVVGNCLMKNSGVTIEQVKESFELSTDLKNADVRFYFDSARDWSDNGNMRKDWIATIRNFARRDIKDGKLKLSKHKAPVGTNLSIDPKPIEPISPTAITREEYLALKNKHT